MVVMETVFLVAISLSSSRHGRVSTEEIAQTHVMRVSKSDAKNRGPINLS